MSSNFLYSPLSVNRRLRSKCFLRYCHTKSWSISENGQRHYLARVLSGDTICNAAPSCLQEGQYCGGGEQEQGGGAEAGRDTTRSNTGRAQQGCERTVLLDCHLHLHLDLNEHLLLHDDNAHDERDMHTLQLCRAALLIAHHLLTFC